MLFNPLRKLKNESAPSSDFRRVLRGKLMEVAQGALPPRRMPVWLRFGVMPGTVALVLLFGLGSYAYASPSVGEDTFLYPVKTKIEKMEEAIVCRHVEQCIHFRAKILDRRVAEEGLRLKRDATRAPLPKMKEQVRTVQAVMESETISEETKAEVRTQMHDSVVQMRTHIEAAPIPAARKEYLLDRFDESVVEMGL